MILQKSDQKCCWKSDALHEQCERFALVGEPYCLFHKSDKNDFESLVFWKIINWKLIPNRINLRVVNFTNQSPQQRQEFNETWNKLYDEEIRLNFTDLERRRPDYQDLCVSVENLRLERQLGRAGNFRIAKFDGFIFPNQPHMVFSFQPYEERELDWPIYFRECVFNGNIEFTNYQFFSPVKFIDVEFQQAVTFLATTFQSSVLFESVHFRSIFSFAHVFEYTKFLGPSVVFKNIKGIHLSLNTAEFGPSTRLVDEGNDFELSPGTASYGREFHLIAKRIAQSQGDLAVAGKHYYQERRFAREEMKLSIGATQNIFDKMRREFNKGFKLWLDWLIDYSCGYGEKPQNAIRLSLIIIFVFAALFLLTEFPFSIAPADLDHAQMIIDAISKSVFTFTTLGYGDVSNYTFSQKILAFFEVVLGILMIAVGSGSLLRKMIR
jgi:hypothetical protein